MVITDWYVIESEKNSSLKITGNFYQMKLLTVLKLSFTKKLFLLNNCDIQLLKNSKLKMN